MRATSMMILQTILLLSCSGANFNSVQAKKPQANAHDLAQGDPSTADGNPVENPEIGTPANPAVTPAVSRVQPTFKCSELDEATFQRAIDMAKALDADVNKTPKNCNAFTDNVCEKIATEPIIPNPNDNFVEPIFSPCGGENALIIPVFVRQPPGAYEIPFNAEGVPLVKDPAAIRGFFVNVKGIASAKPLQKDIKLLVKDFPNAKTLCLVGTGEFMRVSVTTDVPDYIEIEGAGISNKFEITALTPTRAVIGGTGRGTRFVLNQISSASTATAKEILIKGTGSEANPTCTQVINFSPSLNIAIDIQGAMAADIITRAGFGQVGINNTKGAQVTAIGKSCAITPRPGIVGLEESFSCQSQ